MLTHHISALTNQQVELLQPACMLPQNFSGTWFTSSEFDSHVTINATHIQFNTKYTTFTSVSVLSQGLLGQYFVWVDFELIMKYLYFMYFFAIVVLLDTSIINTVHIFTRYKLVPLFLCKVFLPCFMYNVFSAQCQCAIIRPCISPQVDTFYSCQQTRDTRFLMKQVTQGRCEVDYVCFEFLPRHQNIIRFRMGKAFLIMGFYINILCVFSMMLHECV